MVIPAGRNFASCYMELCKRQRLRPLPVICVTLPHSLDFTTDRVKMDDWGPILNSLSLDRTLKSISVHSRYQCRKPLEEVNSEDKARAMGKAPVVITRYLLEWLSQSVGQCVKYSSSLTHLELEGIPFPPDCVTVLCLGLSDTETLRYLSLRRCHIGDAGCELVCRTIADVRSVRSLNLSHCDLTRNCGGALASALSRQKLSLYHDTWKQSLRYREPDLEAMPGLRRLTLNDNPHLSNCTVLQVIEAIRDSLWMKALDLQRCGLTDQIGADLLELLDQNNTLVVLDVRKNVNLNDELATEVMRRLEENDAEGKSEYKWMGLPPRDQRTASADARKEAENEESVKAARPRSGFARYGKRPVLPSRRTIAVPGLSSKTKPTDRAISPPVRHMVRVEQRVRPVSKVSLHLDLQPRIRPAVTQADRDAEDDQPERENAARREEEASTTIKSPDLAKVDVGTQSVLEWRDDTEDEIKSILGRLADARAEHDRLSEQTKRTDRLLAEERARREAVESSLKSAQSDLAELEAALKKKESETRGYLLLSQQSLDEICLSFDRLLEMLENVTANHPAGGTQDKQRIARSDIERRLASVIRQTKSENLKRGRRADVESPSRVADSARKFAKSESDVRSTVPIPATRLETRIGECPENNPQPSDHRRRRDKSLSPGERARAIFASIVSGDAVLDLC